jgi:hypothetical protein
MVILAALARVQAAALVRALVAFRSRATARQKGAEVPMRVFVVPCIQAA